MHQLRFSLPHFSPAAATKAASIDTVPLSPRQRQVLALYLVGQTHKQVAHSLGVSPNTIRNHIQLIYEIFGFTNRVVALRWALEQPALARQILTQSDSNDASEAIEPRVTGSEPATFEEAVHEAIAFFQREVIDEEMELV